MLHVRLILVYNVMRNRVLEVPQQGAPLPQLISSTSSGNFGGFVILGDASYNCGGGSCRSGLTDSQWEQMSRYQRIFMVRMVRPDVNLGPRFGKSLSRTRISVFEPNIIYIDTTTAIDKTGRCNAGVEQLVSISNTSFSSMRE